MQNSTAVFLLTVQLQVNNQLCIKHYNKLVSYKHNISKSNKKYANKDLSYKGAKRICLRQDVYYDLLNSLEVLQQYIENLELELENLITKIQENLTNGNVNCISILTLLLIKLNIIKITRFSQFFGDQMVCITNILYQY
jgi:hypothetical protein